MKTIKRIVILSMVIITAIMLVIKLKLYKRYRKWEIENEIVELLNTGKVGKDFAEDTEKYYKYSINEYVNNYNIDDFITVYINTMEKLVERKSNGKDAVDLKIYNSRIVYRELIIPGTATGFFSYVINDISDIDIENYTKGVFKEKLVKELEKAFTHKGNDINTGWYISGNEEKSIELPYSCYVEYTPANKKNFHEFSKAIKADIFDISTGREEKKYPLIDYIDDMHEIRSITFFYKIIYQTVTGDTKEKKETIILKDNEDSYKYLVFVDDLFYKQTTEAKLELKSHSYDEELRRRNEKEEERVRISNELEARDPSTVQIDYDIKRIEMFKKYNQYAQIDVVTYKDGSKKSFFRKHTSYVNDEGRKIMRYMKRELPYKDVTIEEAYELYINDKEQYSIDEELLKGNQPLVEYISYEQ